MMEAQQVRYNARNSTVQPVGGEVLNWGSEAHIFRSNGYVVERMGPWLDRGPYASLYRVRMRGEPAMYFIVWPGRDHANLLLGREDR
jgi:hypothetical protein